MPSTSAEPTQLPGTITRLADPEVRDLNSQLADLYEEIAARHLAGASESELQVRVRAYDNHQRLTFGRAQSALLPCRDLYDLEFGQLARLDDGGPDRSYFPGDVDDQVYAVLTDVLRHTVSTLLAGGGHDDDLAMLTLFCHRVLVRPREKYRGFFHRDLAPRSGRIGTVIWYPRIRHDLVDGLEFFVYSAAQDVPLGTLRDREPDFKFEPAQYDRSALVLGYPHNYAHGVLPGINKAEPAGRPASLRDFTSPGPDCFVKDLVIVTVSESSPVEQ
jgi:hypothetical protein